MEPYQEPGLNDADSLHAAEQVATSYPPKYVKLEQPANVWMKSLVSLALYLVLGYYIFHSLAMLLLITAIVIFHELGHFFAMKYFRYNDLGIFFIPLLGAYVSGTKREVSQKESAIILLAGPLPGILLGLGCYLLWQQNHDLSVGGVSLYTVSILLIVLNLINLLPVYPLDGGQLLNRVFLDEESWVGKAFIFLSALLMVWLAWKTDWKLWPLLIFPVMMLFRIAPFAWRTNDSTRLQEAHEFCIEVIHICRSYWYRPFLFDGSHHFCRVLLCGVHSDGADDTLCHDSPYYRNGCGCFYRTQWQSVQ